MKTSQITFLFRSLFALILIIGCAACNDLLEQTPPATGSNILPDDAINSAADLNQVLISAYDVLANTYNGGAQALPVLLSDNLVRPFNQNDYTSVWLRSTSIFNGNVSNIFRQYGVAILRSNTVIENLDRVQLSATERNSIEAQARFIRALGHFDCMRSWAFSSGYTNDDSHPGIAIRSSSQIVNAPRSTVGEVYNFILADLAFAQANLSETPSVFANRWAALALEAEVRFQRQEYTEALAIADDILANAPYSLDTAVNRYQYPQVSPEAIFYIFSATRSDGSVDNRSGTLRTNYFGNGNPALRIQQEFYQKLTEVSGGETPRGLLYEELDQDGNISYITHMFDAEIFHIPVLSLTQMLLIRAESLAELNQNPGQAIDDINVIRQRAYGSVVADLEPGASANQIIQAARLERRMEFPFNGQRYYDLVRIGAQGENVIVRGAPWDCPGMILQFPATEQTDLFPLNITGGC